MASIRLKFGMWMTWGALVATDLAMRMRYLAPRLLTLRGAVNYGIAVLVLALLLRLLMLVSRRPRIALFVVLVALPMTIEWAVFRAYGQFASPSDFALFLEAPRVVMEAGGMAVEKPLVAGSFLFVNELGRVLEDPFTMFWNGLPLLALSRTIEANARAPRRSRVSAAREAQRRGRAPLIPPTAPKARKY